MRSFGAGSTAAGVWARSAALTGICVAAVWRVHAVFHRLDLEPLPLSLALACIVVIGFNTAALALISAIIKSSRQLDAKRYLRLAPAVRDRIACHLNGSDQTAALASFRLRNRRVVDRVILEFLSSVTGARKERIARLAVDLRTVRGWVYLGSNGNARQRRYAASALRLLGLPEFNRTLRVLLTDPDESISFEAARALLQTGEAEAVSAAFQFAIEGSLLRRAVLAMDLKRYAALLCGHTIPDALRSPDVASVLATLDIISAWAIALPVDAIVPLTNHASEAVRIAALDAVCWQIGALEFAADLTSRLSDSTPGAQAAAARAIKSLRMEHAVLPLRTLLLKSTSRELLHAVASALAAIGAEGESALQTISFGPHALAANAALAALERIHVGSSMDKGIL